MKDDIVIMLCYLFIFSIFLPIIFIEASYNKLKEAIQYAIITYRPYFGYCERIIGVNIYF